MNPFETATAARDDRVSRRPFDKPLDVLERNALVAKGSLAMLAVGPLLFAAFLAGVFPPGLMGLHLTFLGLFAYVASSRLNLRAKRSRANVRADADGVWVSGKLIVPRARIADGFFQPRPGRDPNKASSYGSSIRLVDKRRRVIFEAEAEESEALEMLWALGLDPGSKRAEFNASSPLYATLGRNLLFIFGMMGVGFLLALLLTALGARAPVIPLLVLPMFFGGMLPSKIAVGVDGVLVRWLWQKKFIPMAQIASVARGADDRIVRLQLVDGREEILYTSMRRRGSFASKWASQHRDAVLARIGEAMMAYRARGTGADVSALVRRGSRTRTEWLEALRKLRESEGGYRDTVVRDDDLWRVLEDPSAPEDARGGAAMLLRRSLDDAGKARVRVAADATASPKLRVALDAAAGDEADEELREALEQLAGEDERNEDLSGRRRT